MQRRFSASCSHYTESVIEEQTETWRWALLGLGSLLRTRRSYSLVSKATSTPPCWEATALVATAPRLAQQGNFSSEQKGTGQTSSYHTPISRCVLGPLEQPIASVNSMGLWWPRTSTQEKPEAAQAGVPGRLTCLSLPTGRRRAERSTEQREKTRGKENRMAPELPSCHLPLGRASPGLPYLYTLKSQEKLYVLGMLH